MKYTNLGRSGLKVSRICFGCMSIGGDNPFHKWTVDEEEGRSLIRTALENGINFFDTANSYAAGQSEVHLGKAIKDFANRDEIVIATKGFFEIASGPNRNGLSRKALTQQLNDSLKRLDMDYVDLYQIHRLDEDTPMEEIMETLNGFVRDGKVRYIGASTMAAWEFQRLNHVAEKNGWQKFISMQNQVSLLYREEEREMLPLCEEEGVGVIPWSPLARGALTRDIGSTSLRSETDHYGQQIYDTVPESQISQYRQQDEMVITGLQKIADQKGVSRAALGLAWHHHKSAITAPIVGVAKGNHITDAVASLDIALSDADITALESNYMTRPTVVSGKEGRRRFDFKVKVRDAINGG